MRTPWVIAACLALGLTAACAPAAAPAAATAVAVTTAPTQVVEATEAPTQPPADKVTKTEAPIEAVTEAPASTPEPTATAAPQSPAAGAVPDGVIADGEYAHEVGAGSVRVLWRNDAESLWLALVGETTGWVAVGIDPENRMQGANFILGAVDGDTVSVWDAYGTAPVGAHPTDESLGGTNDILAFGGAERDGQTIIEVQIPLASGDAYDQDLAPGQTYAIIVAVGSADGFDARHSYRGAAEMALDPAP